MTPISTSHSLMVSTDTSDRAALLVPPPPLPHIPTLLHPLQYQEDIGNGGRTETETAAVGIGPGSGKPLPSPPQLTYEDKRLCRGDILTSQEERLLNFHQGM